ncbi:MAG: YggS family pyridoxal phosphate-dependent enzyme [Candidatus Omnitrophica bacterium]|nr:YggS family pyridoxal phosphate-dependent enzyme [Candidatus Omnitrophota bacterium]
MIKDRLAKVHKDIEAVCKRIGRNYKEIILVGATKYADAAQIKEAAAAGLKHIGENRVQDALEKFAVLDQEHVHATRHMLGHLQTNKAGDAVEIFDLIQSVDSIRLADEIEKHAVKLNKMVEVLVEVNTSGEDQKFGVLEAEVLPLIEEISRCEHIRLSGLMTMAPYTPDKGIIRKCFRDLRELFDAVEDEYATHPRVAMKYLSMGMTEDYAIAIEEGSNMVRIGRAIFKEA